MPVLDGPVSGPLKNSSDIVNNAANDTSHGSFQSTDRGTGGASAWRILSLFTS